ncbi:MAG: branched-chain amino acid transport system II carrier protein [Lachnospiraceae bacterium]|nr:branched-chain amino acid transport system II carrier protein [Lachnospiraceae bacterium]
MERKESHRLLNNVLVIGFALFSGYFGAGNLIFPPFLGRAAGKLWVISFLFFVLADSGLGMLTILASMRCSGSARKVLGQLGPFSSTLLCSLLILCTGPLVVIPRTCATTFELGIKPLFPSLNSWIFSLIFFLAVGLMTIRPSKVVDIVGRYLTPLLLITLAVLCIKGFFTPLGKPGDAQEGYKAVREGILSGYQTMDALAGIPFSIIVMNSLRSKGYQDRKTQRIVLLPACLVAFAGLFLVYGGLSWLGATTSQLNLGTLNQTALLVAITEMLLARGGVVLLGLIVLMACLTTAVGMTSAAADYFSNLTKKKLSYELLIVVICIVGFLISNIGIDSIIRLASPILSLLYPVVLTQVILSFFGDRIKRPAVFRGAAMGAIVTAAAEVAYDFGLPISFIEKLPLAAAGLGWVVPALVFAGISALIPWKIVQRDYLQEQAAKEVKSEALQ